MPAQDRTLEPGHRAQRLPYSCGLARCAALVFAALLFASPGALHASETQRVAVNSSSDSEQAARPAWLRPLGDETDSETEWSGESSADESDRGWAGWSKLEPGVLDVQAWDWLQQDLSRMLDLTTAPAHRRLSVEAFETKYLGATVEFLQIDAEGTKTFQIAVNKALAEIEGARASMLRQRPSEVDLDDAAAMRRSQTMWEEYRKAQNHATRYPLAQLEERPRHELLREAILRWLLRLDFGMEAAAK